MASERAPRWRAHLSPRPRHLAGAHGGCGPASAPNSRFSQLEIGYRSTPFINDQRKTSPPLKLRHRHHARIEDAIRAGKEAGVRCMPFAAFAHNQDWLETSLLAQALLHWAARLSPETELALVAPKGVRQRPSCTSPGI